MHNPRAEAARLRYRYRSMILRGELKLPRDAAIPLVGPDCAYHLYRGYVPGQDARLPQGDCRSGKR